MVAGGGGEGEGGRATGETTGRRQAGVAVGGRRREVKGEGDGGRARGDWLWKPQSVSLPLPPTM